MFKRFGLPSFYPPKMTARGKIKDSHATLEPRQWTQPSQRGLHHDNPWLGDLVATVTFGGTANIRLRESDGQQATFAQAGDIASFTLFILISTSLHVYAFGFGIDTSCSSMKASSAAMDPGPWTPHAP